MGVLEIPRPLSRRSGRSPVSTGVVPRVGSSGARSLPDLLGRSHCCAWDFFERKEGQEGQERKETTLNILGAIPKTGVPQQPEQNRIVDALPRGCSEAFPPNLGWSAITLILSFSHTWQELGSEMAFPLLGQSCYPVGMIAGAKRPNRK